MTIPFLNDLPVLYPGLFLAASIILGLIWRRFGANTAKIAGLASLAVMLLNLYKKNVLLSEKVKQDALARKEIARSKKVRLDARNANNDPGKLHEDDGFKRD